MIGKVEQDIQKKIEREKNIIQGASLLKKKTDNVMVIQKCNTNIREAQQNIEYLKEALKRVRLNERKRHTTVPTINSQGHQSYGQLSTISPDEHCFSRLDLTKYDCPSLSQRIQYMLQQLEFKLQVEKQYQEANDKLTKLYQIDGDQRTSSAAQGGSKDSKQRIQLLTKALKKYQSLNIDVEQFKHSEEVLPSQLKFRRKQLTGVLNIGITAIRDVDHIQSPLFSKKPDTYITIKIDDVIQARTKPSKNDRWSEEFSIQVGKGNEIEIAVYDKVNDTMAPVAIMWLLLSDIAEEIRKKKAGQSGTSGWINAQRPIGNDFSDPYNDSPDMEMHHMELTSDNSSTNVDVSDTTNIINASSWFVLEPAGQILLTLGFKKSNQTARKQFMGGLHRNGAIVNRKEDIYEQHGHHFVQKSFYNIMCCAYCGDFLRYTGFQCHDCKFLCHRKCYTHVVTKCIAKTTIDSDPHEAKLNHHIPHRFEPISNRGTKWCCHCGYILPWGKKNVRKCLECNIMCHAQCAHLVPDFCGMSMEMANKVLTTIQDTRRTQQQRKKPSPISEVSGTARSYPDCNTPNDFPNNPRVSVYQHINSEYISLDYNPIRDEFNEDDLLKNESNIEMPHNLSIQDDIHDVNINDREDKIIGKNDSYHKFTNSTINNSFNSKEEYEVMGSEKDNNYGLEVEVQSVKIEETIKTKGEPIFGKQENLEFQASQRVNGGLTELQSDQNVFCSDLDSQPDNILSGSYEYTGVTEVNPKGQLSGCSNVNKVSDQICNQVTVHEQECPVTKNTGNDVSYMNSNQHRSSQKPALNVRQKKRLHKRRKVSLDDFVLLKVLGKGNFGKVLLAQSKNTQMLCAIKVLKKDHIIKNHDIESARAEKKVFLLATKAKHPFLTNLYCSFQTENRIYFAMEFIGGGDLMWHVQNQRLSVRRAKFYAAEVLLALKHFHDNGVIYRDLKLENILLTPKGHIKIADYGLCKDNMWYGSKTSTFCGTPEFMAPEILKEQEYTKAVDWWAFGVLLYQMLLCQSPFSGDDEDEVFNAILTDEPLYPIDMAGDIVQIFQGLLTKDPDKRLGAGPRDALEVMEEPFFRNINFEDILNLRVEPPYIPEIKSADDTSYFEKEFTSASPTLTPLPSILSSNIQEEFRGFSFMPDDLAL